MGVVRVEISGVGAELSPAGWKCGDKKLERALESFRSPYGPTPSEGDFDEREAVRIVKLFGGSVVSADPQMERKPGVMY